MSKEASFPRKSKTDRLLQEQRVINESIEVIEDERGTSERKTITEEVDTSTKSTTVIESGALSVSVTEEEPLQLSQVWYLDVPGHFEISAPESQTSTQSFERAVLPVIQRTNEECRWRLLLGEELHGYDQMVLRIVRRDNNYQVTFGLEGAGIESVRWTGASSGDWRQPIRLTRTPSGSPPHFPEVLEASGISASFGQPAASAVGPLMLMQMAEMTGSSGSDSKSNSSSEGSGENGSGPDPDSGIDCGQEVPDECTTPSGLSCPSNDWSWQNLMKPGHWYHFNIPADEDPQKSPEENQKFQWKVYDKSDETKTIWEVKTQSTVPATTNRHKYSIKTYCCFSDFNLKFDFRCPDVRNQWTTCSDNIRGGKNWGNSGVYIFNRYEVQIHDSYKGPDSEPDTNVPSSGNLYLEFDPTETGGGGCHIPVDQLCGAIYDERRPNLNRIKKAEGNPPDPESATGWNSMEIGFLAPRWEKQGNAWVKVKNATITVKINTENPEKAAFVAYGITKSRRGTEEELGRVQDNLYDMEWCKSVGPIIIQEHDNRVQFRNIRVNPGWIPMKDGEFDRCWQRPRFPECNE